MDENNFQEEFDFNSAIQELKKIQDQTRGIILEKEKIVEQLNIAIDGLSMVYRQTDSNSLESELIATVNNFNQILDSLHMASEKENAIFTEREQLIKELKNNYEQFSQLYNMANYSTLGGFTFKEWEQISKIIQNRTRNERFMYGLGVKVCSSITETLDELKNADHEFILRKEDYETKRETSVNELQQQIENIRQELVLNNKESNRDIRKMESEIRQIERDHSTEIRALTLHYEGEIRNIQIQYLSKIETIKREHEDKTRGMMEAIEMLKEENEKLKAKIEELEKITAKQNIKIGLLWSAVIALLIALITLTNIETIRGLFQDDEYTIEDNEYQHDENEIENQLGIQFDNGHYNDNDIEIEN